MQPIFHAILQNDLPAFLSLVEEKVSLMEERTDEEHLKDTVLHMAVRLGHGELVSKIIDRRPSLVCYRNAEGNTPLHLAALLGHVDIVMQMLETGLEACTARNNNDYTPLHLACRSMSTEAAKLIAEKTNSVDHGELKYAISSGSTGVAKIILERFPDLAREETWSVQGRSLSTLLHHACDFHENSHDDEVLQLLRLIAVNTTEIAEKKIQKARESLEYDMHIEALQNSRNTVTIVAVLIASVAYAGGINPPGGVYQDGPWRGKSIVGKTTAFKVFAVCNNIALFTSLAIVILFVSIIPYKRKPMKKLLVATHRMMWASVGFMATAYVAASWVTIPHYRGTLWLFPSTVAVSGGVLAVLFSFLGVKAIDHSLKKKKTLEEMPSYAKTSSDLAVSGNPGYFHLAR